MIGKLLNRSIFSIMFKCKNCNHGNSPDPLSDICDVCQNDPDVGWGGFTDHYLGKHFYSDEERMLYLKNKEDCEEEYEE